ncbi:MAG: glycosyltransferase family 2 protein [Acidimicrobiales bacterium]
MAQDAREGPRPCLSVVMPCFNEAATVGTAVTRALSSPWTQELIVVDDGSTDGSLDVVRSLHDPRVRVLSLPRNRGKGAAVREGFACVQAPFVIIQDADLEYDPAEYGLLLEPLTEGKADVVYGSRLLAVRPHRVLYYWHAVGNRLLTTASNVMTNLNLSDMETCYKAFRREVLEGLTIEEDGFGFEPEVTAKVARDGWRIYEVGISYAGRTYAEGKKIGWRDGFRTLYCILRYSRPISAARTHIRWRRPWQLWAAR